MKFLLLALSFLFPILAHAAQSNKAVTARDTVSLVSTTQNGALRLGLLFQLAPGWHIYWSDPGDAGAAPGVTLAPPAKAGPLAFPAPTWLVSAGPTGSYVYLHQVLLPFSLTTSAPAGTRITAAVNWLVCADVCVPEHATFTLTPDDGAAQAPLFAAADAAMPRPSPFSATISPDGTLALDGAGLTPAIVKTAHFFPLSPSAMVNAAPEPLSFNAAGLTLQLKLAPGPVPNLPGVIELTDQSGQTQALSITPRLVAAGAPATSLLVWLGLALLGGLILNLMPCVFPVLAMKAVSVARLSEADHPRVRREAGAYTLGVLAAMLALGGLLLALRAAGQDFGWGFQFQSPIFVALMSWLVFAIGLNFLGVFEIEAGAGLGQSLAAQGGLAGSFFTGLLAVVVATPCTAPFMGGAIAAALAAPWWLGLSVFLALGVGLALPFLLLAFTPQLARSLPRPGVWMLVLKQFLAFPMFATAIWLLWVMALQTGPDGTLIVAGGALALGFAAWLWRFARTKAKLGAAIVALLTLGSLSLIHGSTKAQHLSLPHAAPYSAVRLQSLRAANQPVFVDMTAAWCVTCLVNDRVALDTDLVQSAFAAAHVHVLVGDWTNRDPAITAYLAAHGRDGVPLYVYYPAGHGAGQILPQILTPGIVIAALGQNGKH
jgi:thiol:disulfide interchange protein DsbD